MTATAPVTYGSPTLDRQQPVLEDSDQDAEGEDDIDVFQQFPLQQDNTGATYGVNNFEVAENAEGYNGTADMETETAEQQAVAENETEVHVNNEGTRNHEDSKAMRARVSPDDEPKSPSDADDPDASYESEFSGKHANSNENSIASSDDESDEDEEWEAESNDGRDDADAEAITPNICIVCGQDEEHDPGEEFEECLVCEACGDHCHRQCAREQAYLTSDDDAEKWRCPTCVGNKSEHDSTETTQPKKGSLPSNIARDLLPVHTDASGPKSHSIFNTLIIDADPLDGSRALRKRKSTTENVEGHLPVTRKRQKLASTELEPSGSVDPNLHARAPEDSTAPDQTTRTTRPRRTRTVQKSPCGVFQRQPGKLVLSFRLDSARVAKILNSRRRPQNQRRRPPKPPPPPPVAEEPQPHFAPVNPTPYAAPFYTFNDRENDELKSKPYGGILAEADADTSKTLPLHPDRERFESARRKAEEEWRQKLAMTEQNGEAPRASQKLSGPPSKIKCISFGGYEIETWYAAPYPEEYSRNRALYICEFCLKYMNSDFVAWRHKLKCPAKHPPGDEIYRDGTVSVFEVDGRKNPVYCQNLCLLAKLFLGSKTLYYDVEPFLFYVMTEYDDLGCHFVGYFSKEKRPSSSNNVSCILTLPIHQRKGYGNLLIDFSYLLTRLEGKTGSPEKPLSDMGLVSYRNYWRLVLCYQLRDQKQSVGIAGIAERTGMTPDDIVSGLEALNALVRDPLTKTYALRLDYDYYETYIQKWEEKGYVRLNPDAMVWTPYIMGRSNESHYNRAPIHTVAPRDDHEADGPDNGGTGGTVAEIKSQAEDQPVKVDGIAGTTINSQTEDPSASPLPEIPPGPPSTSALAQGDAPSNHSTDSRYGSATPSLPATSIPPTRFEIFPPLNGSVKRRPGRPFGSTTKHRARPATSAAARSPSGTSGRNTPKRNPAPAVSSPTPVGQTSLRVRRGRSSKLADSVLSVDGSADDTATGKEPEVSTDFKMVDVDELPSGAAAKGMESEHDGAATIEPGGTELPNGPVTTEDETNGVNQTTDLPANGHNDGEPPMADGATDDANQINGTAPSADTPRVIVDLLNGVAADTENSGSLNERIEDKIDPDAGSRKASLSVNPVQEETQADSQ